MDIRLRKCSKATCCRRHRMRLMAIAALRNRLRFLRLMRHVSMRRDLFSAWRLIISVRDKFVERSVTAEASLL